MLREQPEHDPLENLAIVEPEIPHESTAEVLKRFFQFGLPVAMRVHQALCFQLIDDALAECGKRGVEDSFSHSTIQATAELLKLFTDQPHAYDGRLLAHVILLVINRNPISEVEIADMFSPKGEVKKTRAAVSKMKMDLQERWGLIPRCGRSEQAREKFRVLVKLRGPRKKGQVCVKNSKSVKSLAAHGKTLGSCGLKSKSMRTEQRQAQPTQ